MLADKDYLGKRINELIERAGFMESQEGERLLSGMIDLSSSCTLFLEGGNMSSLLDASADKKPLTLEEHLKQDSSLFS